MTKQTKTKIVVGSVVKAKVGELENITRKGRSRRAYGGLGGGGGRIVIAVANSECMLDLWFCVKGHSNKNIQKSEKSLRALRTNNSSLSESYHIRPLGPPSLGIQLQSHLSRK